MNLWMRWVNFRTLREILLIVMDSPGRLRTKDLENIGMAKHVLVNREGKPLGPSSRYHHRRTLERLGLVVKVEDRYVPNYDLLELHILTARDMFGEALNAQEKTAFANTVLRNAECYDVFFRLFMTESERPQNVDDFVSWASPLELEVRTDRNAGEPTVLMRQRNGHGETAIKGAKAVQAIHFGLRSWCVDQLTFVDEMLKTGVGYTLFATYIGPPVSVDTVELDLAQLLPFHGEWATVRVGDLVLDAAIRFRMPVDQVRSIIEGWLRVFPQVVAAITTNERFITAGQPVAQKALILKGFARERSGAYVSHVRIHRDILSLIQAKLTKGGN